jgi:hypothetical protein
MEVGGFPNACISLLGPFAVPIDTEFDEFDKAAFAFAFVLALAFVFAAVAGAVFFSGAFQSQSQMNHQSRKRNGWSPLEVPAFAQRPVFLLQHKARFHIENNTIQTPHLQKLKMKQNKNPKPNDMSRFQVQAKQISKYFPTKSNRKLTDPWFHDKSWTAAIRALRQFRPATSLCRLDASARCTRFRRKTALFRKREERALDNIDSHLLPQHCPHSRPEISANPQFEFSEQKKL